MAIRNKAQWMTLECEAVSESAKALVENLRFHAVAKRPTSIIKAQEATGAILADLVIAQREGVWGKLSLRSNTFSGKFIKYQSFKSALRSLEVAGAIERLGGYLDRSGFGPVGKVSCFRLSEQGRAMLRQEGIDPQTFIAVHFKRRTIGEE